MPSTFVSLVLVVLCAAAYMQFTQPTSPVYESEFEDDKKNGRGKHTWPNGDVYEGEMKDGYGNGQGTMTYASGRRES